MKHRLLSVLAMCTMTISVMAQTWEAPVAPTAPAVSAEDYQAGYSDEPGPDYYLYNVGAGQFVTGANSWATQISLTSDGVPYLKLQIENLVSTDADTYPECVKIFVHGTYTTYGSNGRENGYSTGNKYLFRDSETSGFIDRNTQAVWYWQFTKAESGNYYWQSAPGMGDNKFPNSSEQYARGVAAGAAVAFDATFDDTNIEWQFVPAEGIDLSVYAAYADLMKVYAARKTLYDLAQEAILYDVATDDALVVYNNDEATVAQLEAATEALRPAVNKAGLDYAIVHSTLDEPYDITSYVLVNTDFSSGNIDGWIVDQIGQNLGYQANSAYTNDYVDDDGNDVHASLNQFIEAWYPLSTGALKDGSIRQVVKNLPEGRYRIEADVMAVRQEDGYGEDGLDLQHGIYLYYNNGVYTIHSGDLSTANGKPNHYKFDFDFAGAEEMEIGLMSQGTNCNWMGLDNFKLYAIGPCLDPPAYQALIALVNSTRSYYDDEPKASAAATEAFKTAFENAEDLIAEQSDSELAAAYENAYNTLEAARRTLVETVDAYTQLELFLDQLYSDSEHYADMKGYDDVADLVDELYSQYQTAWEDGAYTAEQATEAIANYSTQIRDAVTKVFEANKGKALAEIGDGADGLDITALFEHMAFANGTTQTAYANGYPAEEPAWQNATSTGNFKVNYSTAEVWNDTSFDIYRELTELPKGKYTITVKGFSRRASHADNYAAFTSGDEETFAYLYANRQQTNLTNAALVTRSVPFVEGNDYNAGTDEEPIYIPNGQQAAHMAFNDSELADIVLNAVSAYITTDGGTLRIGVKGGEGLEANQWTVWEDFRIYYNGISAEALNEDIENLMAELSNMVTYGVEQAEALQADALDKATEAITSDNEEDKTAAYDALNEAIDYLTGSGELVSKLMDLYIDIEDRINNLFLSPSFEDEAYAELFQNVGNAIGASTYTSNEEIEQWIETLNDGFLAYVLSNTDFADASLDAPVDASGIITNATFDNSTKDGWITEAETVGGSGGDGCVEFWQSSTFNFYQELPTLRDGYWRLEVDAFYRAGATNNECLVLDQIAAGQDTALVNAAYLYAQNGTHLMSVKLVQWSDIERGAFEAADSTYEAIAGTYTGGGVTFDAPNNKTQFQSFIGMERYHNTVDFVYNKEDGPVRIGIMKQVAVANDWLPIDNFRLSYLGTEAPSAVSNLAADSRTAGIDAIFTIDGRRVNALSRGINIVRRADGRVQKVLVK